jgi:hypothetical protein
MNIVKIQLMSKNNLQRGSYLYSPIVEIDGKYYRCHSVKTTKPVSKKDIDIASLKISTEIKPESYKANGLIVICLSLFILCFASCKKISTKEIELHKCRWTLCPYKNITPYQYKECVIEYTGEEGTDSYCIDMLHLMFPKDEYEQLEERLFEPMKH